MRDALAALARTLPVPVPLPCTLPLPVPVPIPRIMMLSGHTQWENPYASRERDLFSDPQGRVVVLHDDPDGTLWAGGPLSAVPVHVHALR